MQSDCYLVSSPRPTQPFLESSRNAPPEERCVTTQKTAVEQANWYWRPIYFYSLFVIIAFIKFFKMYLV